MSISTRRGDDGTTGLFHGPRISKGAPRVEAYGALDELGAHLGLARAHAGDDPLAARLEALQRDLFVVGAELATPPAARDVLSRRVDEAMLAELTDQVHELEAIEGMLNDWALPGATVVGGQLDVARTVCRRAERQVVRLRETGEEPTDGVLAWLNRLSDLLWLYARWYERRHDIDGALRPGGRPWR